MTKKNKGRANEILASNVQARMMARYSSQRSQNARIEALRKEARIGKRTVQRILDGAENTTVDSVDKVAQALRCEVYELFVEPATEE